MVDIIGESPTGGAVPAQTTRGRQRGRNLISRPRQQARITSQSDALMTVSMRHAFIPFKGKITLEKRKINIYCVLLALVT